MTRSSSTKSHMTADSVADTCARQRAPVPVVAFVLAFFSVSAAWAQAADPSDITEGKPATAGPAMAARWTLKCRTAQTCGRAI
jgi:hypothetical protein